MSYTLHIGDCLDVLRGIPSNTYAGSLTDPPYGISFMGSQWDKGVPSSTVWAEVLRVLKPGAHLLAFGGTRTFHRLTCAIEDAGFEIRDCLMWLYGTGFPKSHDICKALKKNTDADFLEWSGYGTALKPAWEPCVLAMKPIEGTFAENALAHGVAGLNIDESRIGSDIVGWGGAAAGTNAWAVNLNSGSGEARPVEGRWPANLILDESFAQDWSRFFYCPKASKKERDAGLDNFELKARPTMGSGIGGQPDQQIANNRNNHPCVKPIELNRYLANLILPPTNDGPRRLLVPFSGSEMIGGLLAGWDEVEGIEMEADYVNIAHERIKHWIKS